MASVLKPVRRKIRNLVVRLIDQTRGDDYSIGTGNQEPLATRKYTEELT